MKILREASEQIEIDPRRRRKRAGEIEMMIGIAEPRQRREQDAIA